MKNLRLYDWKEFLRYKFYLLSLFVSVCFVYSSETFIVKKSSFPFLVFNANSYTSVLYLRIKIDHINSWSFIYHLCLSLKVISATKRLLFKMCYLRYRLRIFLFQKKVMFRSPDNQIYVFLTIPRFTKFVTSWEY